MNSKTTISTTSESTQSKCPLWKFTRFFNESYKKALDNILPKRRQLRNLEFLANKSVEWLKKVAWTPCIRQVWFNLDRVSMSRFFAAMVSRILNYEDKRIESLIWVAIVDVLSLVLASQNLWTNKEELLWMIPKSMSRVLEHEEKQENGDMEKKHTLIQDLIYEFIFYSDLEDYKLIRYMKETFEKHWEIWRVCPYYYADKHEKNDFFESVWDMLENQFLPVLQDIYKDRQDLTRQELFYLGKLGTHNENLRILEKSWTREEVLDRELEKTIKYLETLDMKDFLKGYKDQDALSLNSAFISRIIYEMLNSFVFNWVDDFQGNERNRIMWERKYVFGILHSHIVWSINAYYNTKETSNEAIEKLVESNLIPALENIFWDKENLEDTALFYLGKYNEIKK